MSTDQTRHINEGCLEEKPLSRRNFLKAAGAVGVSLALAGLGSGLAGCAKPPSEAAEPAEGSLPGYDLSQGAEPSAYRPASPLTVPFLEPATVEVTTEVCVVGGGAAGMCAATVAARMGARVVLVEESLVLGGNVTRGLVSLDRIGWGGRPMVAGWYAELIRALAQQGDAVFPGENTQLITPCDADALRHHALVLATEAGVDLRLGTKALGAEIRGRSSTAASPSGDQPQEKTTIDAVLAREQGILTKIKADLFVDCTGEGHLGYWAGNRYWLGDRKTGSIQGQTLIFCAAPVALDELWSYAHAQGYQAESYRIVGFRDLMHDLQSSGVITHSAQDGMLIDRRMWRNTVSISGSEVHENHLQLGAFARITCELEGQDQEIHQALRARIPGFQDSRIVRLAERPYLREGRRLLGYHQLSAAEIGAALKPDDSIARGYYPVDLHLDGQPVQRVFLAPGDWYGIPYRCIVAQDLTNLLMAGRCISVTHEALGSTRISPVSMALGQAAGVAAALCVRSGVQPADLPAAKVRTELHRQRALI